MFFTINFQSIHLAKQNTVQSQKFKTVGSWAIPEFWILSIFSPELNLGGKCMYMLKFQYNNAI